MKRVSSYFLLFIYNQAKIQKQIIGFQRFNIIIILVFFIQILYIKDISMNEKKLIKPFHFYGHDRQKKAKL